MCPGLTDDLRQVDDARKTAVINNDLKRQHIDIAAPRLDDDGMLRETDNTFFWNGKVQDEKRMHGVDFAVKNSLLPTIVPPVGGSERLLSISMMTTSGKVTLISAYAPHLCSLQDDKDKFYEDLKEAIEIIPQKEHMFMMCEFIALGLLKKLPLPLKSFGSDTIKRSEVLSLNRLYSLQSDVIVVSLYTLDSLH
ncbi:craniofacial development protein 2 [Biomphalaria glabrata]|nr:craniofacial development protein 2 [Biomphalaria glabrata]